MGVKELEKVAIDSQKEPIQVGKDLSSVGLGGVSLQDHFFGITVEERREELRKHYPNGKIIAVDLGCHLSTVPGDMDRVRGVAAFGIDLNPILNVKQKLPAKRLIVADLNNMPHIPSDSFHYVRSFNCLSYTNPARSFPEIYRIMKPGAIADLDLEWWTEEHGDTLLALPIADQINVRAVRCGVSLVPQEIYCDKLSAFLSTYKERCKKDPEFNMSVARGTCLVMSKPNP